MPEPIKIFLALTSGIFFVTVFFVAFYSSNLIPGQDTPHADQISELQKVCLFAAGLASLGFSVCVWSFVRQINSRLKLLEIGMNKLASGQLGFLIASSGRQKKPSVITEFNALSGALAVQFSKLQNRVRDVETKLANTSAELRFVIDNLDDVLAVGDENGRLIFQSRAIEPIFPDTLGRRGEIISIAELLTAIKSAHLNIILPTTLTTTDTTLEQFFADAGDYVFSLRVHRTPSGGTALLYSKAAQILQSDERLHSASKGHW
jgi:hypothetical protein